MTWSSTYTKDVFVAGYYFRIFGVLVCSALFKILQFHRAITERKHNLIEQPTFFNIKDNAILVNTGHE